MNTIMVVSFSVQVMKKVSKVLTEIADPLNHILLQKKKYITR